MAKTVFNFNTSTPRVWRLLFAACGTESLRKFLEYETANGRTLRASLAWLARGLR